MKRVFSLFAAAVVLGACSYFKKEQPEASPVDALVAQWNYGWNSHDSVGIRNMFADDAVLFDDNYIGKGKDMIGDQWVRRNIKAVNNMATRKIQEWSTQKSAGYSGTFELDYLMNDSTMYQSRGAITINWVKEDGDDWKISNAHISSVELE